MVLGPAHSPKGYKMKPITLTGSNSFLVREELSKIIKDFIAKHGDFGIEKIDGEETEYERITETLQATPFLSTKRLVVLRNPSANKKFAEKIEEILDDLPEHTELIIVETKLDKRLNYFKTLQKKTDFRDKKELEEEQLTSWVQEFAKKLGCKITASDTNYLINKTGPNQELLAQEIEKLVNFSSDISKETIDQLVEAVPGSTIFELIDAAVRGDKQKALAIYDEQRQQKVEPLAIMGMLAWQLHVLATIKAAGSRPPANIASEAHLNPFVVRKNQGTAKNLSLEQIKSMVKRAEELDAKLKTSSIDADDSLKHYLLTLVEA